MQHLMLIIDKDTFFIVRRLRPPALTALIHCQKAQSFKKSYLPEKPLLSESMCSITKSHKTGEAVVKLVMSRGFAQETAVSCSCLAIGYVCSTTFVSSENIMLLP